MSSPSTGRRNARRASVDRICSAQAGSSAAAAGRQTKTRSRVGVSLTPVTLYGPSTTPSSSRGMPEGLWASSDARRPGSHAFCSCAARSRPREGDVVRAGRDRNRRRRHRRVDGLLRDVDAFRDAELVQLGAADLGREHRLAVDDDQELMRPIVAFDAEQAFLDAAHEPAREHVLAVGRERVPDARAAARAERHAVEMLVLSQLEREAVSRGRDCGVGIADGHVGDAQRDRQIALEQQRRGRQDLGDVVESEIAAVARQQRRDVRFDAEQVADRVRVLGAVQADARSWRRRTDSRPQRRRACPRALR